jgi:two-component system, chemotaxis family, chemotaxis protein CheY
LAGEGEASGHAVAMVPSGEEALLKLGSGFTPDVVILDMNMPSLGGTGTLPRLRNLNATVPVLLMTGRAVQAALDLVAAHPFLTLLSKHFSMDELKHSLKGLRPGKRATSSWRIQMTIGWLVLSSTLLPIGDKSKAVQWTSLPPRGALRFGLGPSLRPTPWPPVIDEE